MSTFIVSKNEIKLEFCVSIIIMYILTINFEFIMNKYVVIKIKMLILIIYSMDLLTCTFQEEHEVSPSYSQN